jgi:hypothetical protein
MPARNLSGVLTANEQANLTAKAMSGDIVLSILPATTTRAATAAAWTRKVTVKALTAAGELHSWLNAAYATKAAIADTSSAGTATIASTTLTLVNGAAEITVSGDAAAWLAGVQQVETIEVTNGATDAAGTLVVTVTSAGMTGSPKAVNVVLLETDDTAAKVATKIAAALADDAAIGGKFDVTVDDDDVTVVLTAKVRAANDATLAVALTSADSTGVTVGASTDAVAGVAPETNTLTIGNIEILGYTVTGGTSVETIVP